MNKVKTVEEYIAQAPLKVQFKLKEIRKIIKTTAPNAEEKISYGMPYYEYKGRLAYFAYFKDHISFYGMNGVLDDFESELKGMKTGRATLRISLDKKIPASLIKKLIKATIKKNEH